MRGQRGAVLPLAAGAVVAIVIVALVLQVVGAALLARRQAAAAADLAALAGAVAVQRGADGCEAATKVASANEAELVGCEIIGQVVDVRVERVAPPMFGRDLRVAARAKAGPE